MIASSAPARPMRAWGFVASVIFAAAAGPIVIREAQLAGLPSLQIIFFRLLLTIVLLTPTIVTKHRADFGRIQPRDAALLVAAGAFFAANLVLLFFSLEYTSVLIVGVLRRTSPLWLVGLEVVLLGVRFRRELWAGLLIVIVASIIVGLNGSQVGAVGSNPQLGAALALIGAVCISAYLLLGRALTKRVNGLLYSWLVFASASCLILIVIVATDSPWLAPTWSNFLRIAIITIVTQFMGHIPINYALQYFPATVMSLFMQGAVVLSAIMAFFVYAEIPTLTQIVGSCAILFGVYMITRKGAEAS